MSKLALQLISENTRTKGTVLDLSNCELGQLPSQLSQSFWLKELYLNFNLELQDLSPLQNLTSLQNLVVLHTKVADLSPLQNLTALQTLVISNTQVTDLSPLKNLTNLQRLIVSNTQIVDLSPLKDLIEKGIPVEWSYKYRERSVINVQDCPLTTPPLEVVQQGNQAILNYFSEIEEQGTDTLYEAKLLLIGDGGAGKTSLYHRLCRPDLPLPPEKDTTKGIDIHRYEFPLIGGQNFRLNVWDFGGQDIYHATHQFFLTKRSLYVLLDDTRSNHKTVQDEGFKYWLEVVETLSEKSPVLIFQNEKGGRSKEIDFAGIKGRFDNVKECYRGNLEHLESISDIREAIAFFAKSLPHIGESLPKKWVFIRQELEELAETTPYISQKDYFDIYAKYLPANREKALYLSRYLHDLGVFLHFQDDRLLSKTVILQNAWATEAVFKMLDDEAVKSKQGRFTEADCLRLWLGSVYIDMNPELLALMSKFELCYQLPDVRPDTWLAPQLLPVSKPSALSDWDSPGDLVLRYEYAFLPKGLVNRLMVRQHRFVQDTTLAWRSGVFFEREDTQVLVEISYTGLAIAFRARGIERKDLLNVLSAELDALNESFEGLRGKVVKKIPCNCETCLARTTPHFYDFEKLRERKKLEKKTIECANPPYLEPSVQGLLDGVFPTIEVAVIGDSPFDKPKIESLLEKGKVKDALELLRAYYPAALVLLGQYNTAQRDRLSGLIDTSEFEKVQNRLLTAAQEILEW